MGLLLLEALAGSTQTNEWWTNAVGHVIQGRLAAGNAHAVTLVLPRPGEALTSAFVRGDIVNSQALVDLMREAARPVDAWLWTQLRQVALTNEPPQAATGDSNEWIEAVLVPSLNGLVSGGLLHDPRRFSGVRLRLETETLLSQRPRGEVLAHLNRLLLEDAYPGAFAKVKTTTVPLRSLSLSSQHRAAWLLGLPWPLEPPPPSPRDQAWERAVKLHARGYLDDKQLDWISVCLEGGTGASTAKPPDHNR